MKSQNFIHWLNKYFISCITTKNLSKELQLHKSTDYFQMLTVCVECYFQTLSVEREHQEAVSSKHRKWFSHLSIWTDHFACRLQLANTKKHLKNAKTNTVCLSLTCFCFSTFTRLVLLFLVWTVNTFHLQPLSPSSSIPSMRG